MKRFIRFIERITRTLIIRFTNHDFANNFFGKLILRFIWKDQLEDFNNLVFRKDLLEKLIRLQSLKIQIFIVSNTEIPNELIALKLRDSGLNHLQICTSKNYQMLKSQGLYQEILSKFHIHMDSVVVIGDDADEDLLSAEKLGILNFHIQSFKDLIKPILSAKQLQIISRKEQGLTLLSNLVSWMNDNSEIKSWEIVGFFYSALLSNFIAESLFERIKDTQDTEVIFLSREGYLPHYSFKSHYRDSIVSHYLYVSRTLLYNEEGLKFIGSQLKFDKELLTSCAIFDIGWRGRSVSQVRELLSVPGNNFFLALWPWRKGPTNSTTLLVPRWNLRRALILRKCPEILEFILAAPHKTMSSTDVVSQATDSPEHAICKGFQDSWNHSTPSVSRELIFKIFAELLSNPSREQALFFGGIKHSVNGEQERTLLGKDPVLWLQGVRAAKSVNKHDILREYIRRFLSFVKQ
jgi:FMN phosphatase YigB (HAD superfamily)